jgi:hypothetical protein
VQRQANGGEKASRRRPKCLKQTSTNSIFAQASSNRIELELSGQKGADHFITSAPDAPDQSTGADHLAVA